jgi:hypothetical protein
VRRTHAFRSIEPRGGPARCGPAGRGPHAPTAAPRWRAVGIAGNIVEGLAVFALDQPTTDKANADALRDCKTPTRGIDPRAQALCTVVQAFKNQCFAVAMDPKDATPGVGWAVEGDKESATRAALAKCVATAGADRRDACEVTHSGCDGNAK